MDESIRQNTKSLRDLVLYTWRHSWHCGKSIIIRSAYGKISNEKSSYKQHENMQISIIGPNPWFSENEG